MKRYKRLTALAEIFLSMHEINIKRNSIYEIKSTEAINSFVDKKTQTASEQLNAVMSGIVTDEYKEAVLEFVDISTLPERLKDQNVVSIEFIGKVSGWCRARFILVENFSKTINKVLFVVERIDLEKRKEERLIQESTIDALTGCYNRKAFEDDLRSYPGIPPEKDFVFVSVDVNGLKEVNDTKGHAAGDEIIRGAADCIKQCIGPYGKTYRVGGDEFSAIFFADRKKLDQIKKDLKNTVLEWRGEQVETLSISCGYVRKTEFEDASVKELADIADERMYKEKEKYYRNQGLDRRSQMEAFRAICASYIKIIKYNLTEDKFDVIQVASDEVDATHGYKEIPSEWLESFAKSGNIHPDDLDEFLEKTNSEFLKEYFAEDNVRLNIKYRRKIEGEFRMALLEMVRASEYSVDKQVLYVYVKEID